MPLDLFSVTATFVILGFAVAIIRWLGSYWRAHQKLMKRWQRSSYGPTERERVSALRRQIAPHVIYLFILSAMAFIAIETGSVTPHGRFLLVFGLTLLPWLLLVLFETKTNLDTARSRKEEPAAPVPASEAPVTPRQSRRPPSTIVPADLPTSETPAPRRSRRSSSPKTPPQVH